MLEDLVLAAVSQAQQRAAELYQRGEEARLGPAVPVSAAAITAVSAIEDLVTELAKLPGSTEDSAAAHVFTC